ncbi:MAG TPA: hypothetical protein ENH62_10130 [Marinobacter sp.]|uniref:Uncharacterized protein n=1 Tax=marine sediment metagenome TaxID=412755 RepID=A0A0F9LU94_9ZZZZ|nr:hypothetical protein [Marinobacter sp.]
MDERIIDWGVSYLKRRFPIVKLDDEKAIRNAVSDLMFMGKYGRHREPGAVVIPGKLDAE